MQRIMLPEQPSVQILSSMMGFGVYLPAQLINQQLQQAGISSEIFLIEKLFTAEKKKTFLGSREAFGKNYRLAQLAAKVQVDYSSCVDPVAACEMYKIWDAHMATDFLCFSGLWFDVLEAYVPKSGRKNIRCCRIDAGEATTWANRNKVHIDHTYYFSNLNAKEINYTLRIPAMQPLQYEQRQRSVLVHGGGWALGNYYEETAELERAGYYRKIIVNDMAGSMTGNGNARFLFADPDWDPLLYEMEKVFPPIGVYENGAIKYTWYHEHHAALKEVNESKAVISKPGGMTLVDAITTETPFIYLDAMGPNEKGNTVLIDHYKIGASYETWKESGFSEALLTGFHNNIRKLKETLPDFGARYIQDLKQ